MSLTPVIGLRMKVSLHYFGVLLNKPDNAPTNSMWWSKCYWQYPRYETRDGSSVHCRSSWWLLYSKKEQCQFQCNSVGSMETLVLMVCWYLWLKLSYHSTDHCLLMVFWIIYSQHGYIISVFKMVSMTWNSILYLASVPCNLALKWP